MLATRTIVRVFFREPQDEIDDEGAEGARRGTVTADSDSRKIVEPLTGC